MRLEDLISVIAVKIIKSPVQNLFVKEYIRHNLVPNLNHVIVNVGIYQGYYAIHFILKIITI